MGLRSTFDLRQVLEGVGQAGHVLLQFRHNSMLRRTCELIIGAFVKKGSAFKVRPAAKFGTFQRSHSKQKRSVFREDPFSTLKELPSGSISL